MYIFKNIYIKSYSEYDDDIYIEFLSNFKGRLKYKYIYQIINKDYHSETK